MRGPVQVMLAKAQDVVPRPAALSGGAVYEMKLDGYRGALRVIDGTERSSGRGMGRTCRPSSRI